MNGAPPAACPAPHTSYELATTAMSTAISVQLIDAGPDAEALAQRALEWFAVVEACCSRFDPNAEALRVMNTVGAPQPVSPLLYELLRVALAVAEASEGAFDPCVGHHLHALGFDRHWRSGEPIPALRAGAAGTWRDVELHEREPQLLLRRAVHLDLGAIAKGFALDLAARALAAHPHLCVYAGGDLICRGHNGAGRPWRTGIRDPNDPSRLVASVSVAHQRDVAICTSGAYARRTERGHHLIDPGTGDAAIQMHSATVVAPQAAIADALATAVFVLGVERGAALLREQQVDGLLIDAHGALTMVHGWGASEWQLPSEVAWS